MVKEHIQVNCEQPTKTISFLMADMESSSESYQNAPQPQTLEFADDCCSIRCGCFNCNWNPCCSRWFCCVILATMFSFLTVLAVLACYTNIFPQVKFYVHSKEDLGEFIRAVIIILGFFAICCICYVICTMKRRKNSVYAELRSNDGTESMSNLAAASYTTSSSMRTSCSAAYIARKTYCPKCSSPCSGHITASSSFTSMGTPELEAVTDSCLQQDVFTPVIEADDREDDEFVAREDWRT